ncbi:unnamed protein product [Darwinula stevensoni]|uniref:Uncharacterized protein n=1 Tax=Darwinula stevensoni TaxID=69355 RepID=A0A7R8XF41_9CRUS|nr:unnamed protein product [Darwinula stevensoni]CAG0891257.1 unnamed protein product [Darwinula stevensoni]
MTQRRENGETNNRNMSGKQSASKEKHSCEEMRKLACLTQLEKYNAADPRQDQNMKVCLPGYEDLPFCEGAKKYQEEYYPEAENGLIHFLLGTSSKEESAHTPSFIANDYDFNTTFYKAIGIAGKWTKKQETSWKRKGFTIVHGDHDACGIIFDGERVLVLFFEVKSRTRTNEESSLQDLLGKAEYQLQKSKQIFQQIVGATAYEHTYLCCFVALPYMSRREVASSLRCDCDANILTADDLASRRAKEFLEERGINLTRRETTDEKAKECYLDVVRTYVAASASVDGIPRTMQDLHENIEERMKIA